MLASSSSSATTPITSQKTSLPCRNGIKRRTPRIATLTRAANRDDGSAIDAEVLKSSERSPSDFDNIFKSSANPLQVQPLIEELRKGLGGNERGEAWFLAQIALLAALLFPPGPLEVLVREVGGVAAVFGLLLAAVGQQSLGNSLSPFPAPRREEDHDLITDGIYSYSRHPMYGGLLLLAFGLTAATGSDLRFATSFALYFVLSKKVELEEAALVERYGEKYESYQDKPEVKRFIPWIL